jgi:hypothetical protein
LRRSNTLSSRNWSVASMDRHDDRNRVRSWADNSGGRSFSSVQSTVPPRLGRGTTTGMIFHEYKSIDDEGGGSNRTSLLSRIVPSKRIPKLCTAAHVPYNHNAAPFAFMRLVPCLSCRRKWVPETILASIDPPSALEFRGSGQLLEARVCRTRVSSLHCFIFQSV